MGFRKVKRIELPYGQLKRMVAHFGCTPQTIHNALTYYSDSEQAAKIRREAIENYGGKELTVNKYFR